MKWFRRLYSKAEKRLEDPVFRDKLAMLKEIRKAHSDWKAAHMKLNWVVEKDQIDYAIYALEAAEKRYEMLVRQAKQWGWEDGILVASHAYGTNVQDQSGSAQAKGKASSF